MATPEGSQLTITVRSRRRAVWEDGEITVLLYTLRLVGRILPGCSAHFLLSLSVRSKNWGVLLLACRVGGLDLATSSRLLGRAVGLVDTQAVATWRSACRTFDANTPMCAPGFTAARIHVRDWLRRMARVAGELPPWDPPRGSDLFISAAIWGITEDAADSLQPVGGHRVTVWRHAARRRLPLPMPASGCPPAPPAPSSAAPLEPPISSRTRSSCGAPPEAPSLGPCVGSFYMSQSRGQLVVVAVRDDGVLCALVDHGQGPGFTDIGDEPSAQGAGRPGFEDLPVAQVVYYTVSRHGGDVDWGRLVDGCDVSRELRDVAIGAEVTEAEAEQRRVREGLQRFLQSGRLRFERAEAGRSPSKHPLLHGRPPPGFHLLAPPRVQLTGGFAAIVGLNPGPRRQLSTHVAEALRKWGVASATGGCVSFAQLQARVRWALSRAGRGSPPAGAEFATSLSAEEARSLVTYHVTLTMVRSRGRHLIMLGGSEGPQYLGVPGGAALMGITAASAPRLHGWLLQLARGKEELLAAGRVEHRAQEDSGALAATSMLGSAIHFDVATLLLRRADSMLRPDVVRSTVAEHYAGLAVSTAAAVGLWPDITPTFFSDTDPLARRGLAVQYPAAVVCEDASHPDTLLRFPRSLFLLILGFPCNAHSGLARTFTYEQKLATLSPLFEALVPLSWGAQAPAVVLIENTEGILHGVFDALCARLVLEFGKDYHWSVGLLCPSIHAGVPNSRLRVYLLAVRRDLALPASEWPKFEEQDLLQTLHPLPLRRGRLPRLDWCADSE